MTRPVFGTLRPPHRRRPRVHPDQLQLALLTVILGNGHALQVLPGGRPAAPEPTPAAPAAATIRRAA